MSSPRRAKGTTFPNINLSTVGYFESIPADIRNIISGYDAGTILLDQFSDHLARTYLPLYGYQLDFFDLNVIKDKIKMIIRKHFGDPFDLNDIENDMISTIKEAHDETRKYYQPEALNGDIIIEYLYSDAGRYTWDLIKELDDFFRPELYKETTRSGPGQTFMSSLQDDIVVFVYKLLRSSGFDLVVNLTDDDFEDGVMPSLTYSTAESAKENR